MSDWTDWEDDILENDDPENEVIESDEDSYEDSYDDEESHDEELPEEDAIESFLRSKGVDPESVKIETENGIESVNFNDLSEEDKLAILKDSPLDDDYGLNEDEVSIINAMRANNWSSKDYNNYIANMAIKNYNEQYQNEPLFTVDEYSDEELFVMDLQSKIPNITEDEAVEELTNAKSNEQLWLKKIKSLREEYESKEEEEQEYYQKQVREAQMLLMNEFKNTILSTIEKNRDIDLGGIPMEMSDEDMNTVASFILDSDAAGVRHIAKALNDPNAIFQMAWWLTKGQDAFREINNYYKLQISEVAKNNYNRGVEDARSGNINSAKAVVKKPHKSYKSLNNVGDLYDGMI